MNKTQLNMVRILRERLDNYMIWYLTEKDAQVKQANAAVVRAGADMIAQVSGFTADSEYVDSRLRTQRRLKEEVKA